MSDQTHKENNFLLTMNEKHLRNSDKSNILRYSRVLSENDSKLISEFFAFFNWKSMNLAKGWPDLQLPYVQTNEP